MSLISKKASLFKTFGLIGSVPLLGVMLYACSGSVLFHDIPSAPSNPSPAQNPRPDMKLTPLSTGELDGRGGAIKLIFGPSSISSSFDLNNAQSPWIVDLRVKSESVDEESLENFVRAQMHILIIRSADQRILAERAFRSEGTLTLKNIGEKDQMLGTFKDTETGKILLSIQAERKASSTEMAAAQNPWSGSLYLIESDHSETKLGDISGYFSGVLDSEIPGSP